MSNEQYAGGETICQEDAEVLQVYERVNSRIIKLVRSIQETTTFH